MMLMLLPLMHLLIPPISTDDLMRLSLLLRASAPNQPTKKLRKESLAQCAKSAQAVINRIIKEIETKDNTSTLILEKQKKRAQN